MIYTGSEALFKYVLTERISIIVEPWARLQLFNIFKGKYISPDQTTVDNSLNIFLLNGSLQNEIK